MQNETIFCLASTPWPLWLGWPSGSIDPASTALGVIETHKLPHRDKEVVQGKESRGILSQVSQIIDWSQAFLVFAAASYELTSSIKMSSSPWSFVTWLARPPLVFLILVNSWAQLRTTGQASEIASSLPSIWKPSTGAALFVLCLFYAEFINKLSRCWA